MIRKDHNKKVQLIMPLSLKIINGFYLSSQFEKHKNDLILTYPVECCSSEWVSRFCYSTHYNFNSYDIKGDRRDTEKKGVAVFIKKYVTEMSRLFIIKVIC